MKGSITKRVGPRGVTWYGKFSYDDAATGKRKHGRVSAPTRKECEAKLRAAIAAVENGATPADDKVTVREFVERWLATKEHTVRPTTYRRYLDVMNTHVLPVIGGARLARLTVLDVQRVHEHVLNAGLSPTTAHHAHCVLHGALESALRWGLVPRNVAKLVDPPRRAKPQLTVWSAAEAAAFLEAGDRSKYAALWWLAIDTGMRRGELLGLMWEDVDLDRGVLSVRRALTRGTTGRWEVGQPKTASGRRAIALSASCVAALRHHRAEQNAERLRKGPAWEQHGFVFTNAVGGPLHVNALIAAFAHVMADAGVPRIRFHDLRHTCATLLLERGIHPKVVQERLGHSTVSMTLDRYSHVAPSLQEDAADALEAALKAAKTRVS